MRGVPPSRSPAEGSPRDALAFFAPEEAPLPEDKVEIYASAIRGLLALEPEGDKRAKYADFIDIYAGLTENERRLYRRQYPEEGATMAGIVQRARDEGVRQGRVEEARAVLQRLRRRRFGILTPAIADRLGQA